MSTVKKAAIILTIVLLLAVGGVYGFGVYFFSTHYLPNTNLNEFNIAFMTISDATNLLNEEVKTYALAIEDKNGGVESLTAEQIGMSYQPGGELSSLMEEQNEYLWFLPQDSASDIELNYTIDDEMLREAVNGLSGLQSTASPVNARIIYDDTEGFCLIPETEGYEIDSEQAYAAIESAVHVGDTSVDLTPYYLEPDVREEDLQEKYEQLKAMEEVVVTYDFSDRTERVDITNIVEWLDDDYELNREKVAEYIAALAATYDTVGMQRTFITYDDRTVTIEGGDYGWAIDQEQETDALIEILETGATQVRSPIYSSTGVSRASNDVGYTYIEIDTGFRQLIYYQDGAPLIQTTGEFKDIPGGFYSLKSAEEYPAVDDFAYWFPFTADFGIYNTDEVHLNITGTETTGDDELDEELNEILGEVDEISDDDWGVVGCFGIETAAAEQLEGYAVTGIPVIIY